MPRCGVEASLAEGEVVEFRRSIGPEGKERAVEVTGLDGAYVQGRSQVTTSERLTLALRQTLGAEVSAQCEVEGPVKIR